jgi:hypothetical protein
MGTVVASPSVNGSQLPRSECLMLSKERFLTSKDTGMEEGARFGNIQDCTCRKGAHEAEST